MIGFNSELKEATVRQNLKDLYVNSPRYRMGEADKLVIFSDLHLGDGGKQDDFLWNSGVFTHVLEHYYQENGYTLFLNGDIEELQRFCIDRIKERWGHIYQIFAELHKDGRLIKIVGNHDIKLKVLEEDWTSLYDSMRVEHPAGTIFVFHGHQASMFFYKYNNISGFFLKYFAKPLRIRNYSVAHDSNKQFKIESRVYDFAAAEKIVSIIGHTHRPLFESLSKADSIRYRIEELLRKHPGKNGAERKEIEEEILENKRELKQIYAEDRSLDIRSSIYNSDIVVPSLFNSGCVIGKRGITSIEIDGSSIRLVHWFEEGRTDHYSTHEDGVERLDRTSIYRKIIKQDKLAYIFTRINLLT